MHIREAKTVANGKTYHYVQLAESYRNKNGTPATRVIANLNHLSDQEVENLRIALEAARQGKSVAVVTAVQAPKPQANLDYLELAVLLELSRRCGLDALLQDVLPRGGQSIPPSEVALAIVLNRLSAPCSKFAVSEWFANTALPELLDVDADKLGNTRLHRVLSALAEQTPAIMKRLPAMYGEGYGPSSSLFIDLTDATFEGNGPEKARKGRCKDDTIRQRVGIVLLCNERGYPLRWQVVEGNAAEAPVMIQQMREVSRTTWAKGLPIVADRALGHTAYVRELLAANVRFVTAMTRNELRAYAPGIDFDELSKFDPSAESKAQIEWFRRAGFAYDSETLFYRDLGVVTRTSTTGDSAESMEPTSPVDTNGPENRAAKALELGIAITRARDGGAASSYNEAARALGLPNGCAKRCRRLVGLTDELQTRVLNGEAYGISLRRLVTVAQSPGPEQRAAFDELLRQRDEGKLFELYTPGPSNRLSYDTEPVEVRVVVYFNPKMCVAQRKKQEEKLKKARGHVRDLNTSAAEGRSNRTPKQLFAAASAKLKELGLVTVFDLELVEHKGDAPQLRLTLNEAAWATRRALDGCSLLVADPRIEIDAAALCRLYRAKDAVEKDFQTIKTVIRMLPVRHWTDPKVTAHITICVLALALERLLRDELAGLATADEAIRLLSRCRLNRYGTTGQDRAYVITTPSEQQSRLLRRLQMSHLADDDQMAEQIHPK